MDEKFIIGAIFSAVGFCIKLLIDFFSKKSDKQDKENPVITEARLLKFKQELDDEYAKKEDVSCLSKEFKEVSGKLDTISNNFNQFKLDMSNQIGSMNTSIQVMAEAMKHFPRRKED